MYINIYVNIYNDGLCASSNSIKMEINRCNQVNSNNPENWNVIAKGCCLIKRRNS